MLYAAGMKILLCGSESPLGRSLVFKLEQMPFSLLLMEAAALSAITVSELETLLREKQVDGIVNVQHLPLAGEKNDAEFTRQYTRNPETLARAAATTGCFLLQLSDCQVFSGKQPAAYRETDEPDATTPYGALRWAGERAVIDHCPRHLILRTGELFSSLGTNVLTNLLDAWYSGNAAPVSVRYQFCPTSVRDASRVIVALLQQIGCGIEPWGVYHYCGTDTVSHHDFARLVKQIIESQPVSGLVMDVKEIAEGLPPLSWALDCGKIRNTFGIKQHAWRVGLTSGVKRALLVRDPANTRMDDPAASQAIFHTTLEEDNDGGCD